MKMINKSTLIILTILMIITLVIPSYSNASSNGFISFNNAPRKSFSVSSSKFADVTITVEDGNGINSVLLYSVDSNGNKKQIKFSTSNTVEKTKHIYTLSHSDLLKGKAQSFYIKIKDGSGNIQDSGFRVYVKTKTVNGKNVKYYAIDDGPRAINWKAGNDKVSFQARDYAGTKYVKVQDINNGNKEIYNLGNSKTVERTITLDMTKFKVVNDTYKLKIITADTASKPQVSARTVSFKIPEVKKKEPTSSSNTTTQVSKNKNVSSFMASMEKISKQVQKDYKSGKKWKYSNGVSSINKLPVKATFASAVQTNTRNTNCADYVMWALHECGVLASNQKFYGHKSGGIKYRGDNKAHQEKVKETLKKYATITKVGNKTAKQLMSAKKLKKGDICLYKGHTNVYVGDNKWYDAGRRKGVNGDGSNSNYTFTTLGPIKNGTYNKTVTYIIRLKDQT